MRFARRSLDSSGVQCLWRNPAATRGCSAAVSLHSHTLHSREYMDFVPRALHKVPPAGLLLDKLERRHLRRSGSPIAYDRAFWRPPLNPSAAHDLECRQIHELLGLRAMVSLTDHDDMRACADLQTLGMPVPYSSEWTVPFRETTFHVGVHNLPPELATCFAHEMAQYTAAPEPQLLAAILAELDALPQVLVVLNHPFCTELRLPRAAHALLLHEFLKLHGERLHALELNGLQPASDNRDVMRVADAVGLPVISGGDRHCLEPNATVNLTRASDFSEFVEEVRRDRYSRVLFLPQYREPLASRYIQFIRHAVQDYPQQQGREHWTDRVFYEPAEGGVAPLSVCWPSGGPAAIHWFIAAIGLLSAPPLRATLRLALGEQGEVGA